ncbi:hypothetical protein [Aeoliella mucimassa]|uniref:Uncharacterized protein n=1 Tax=Aeoliella mucimassa TaxID=2527972 RepID=A0A518AV19_9BACT|nr:hypothetical protein [Aeoliella mucimassa]QDU58563.1 hypothetical protein Pan181_48020 [Aeoliella mucimassa]
MHTASSAKNVVASSTFGLIVVFTLMFWLPQFGSLAMAFGCAVLLSAYVLALPDQFRTQSGSLVPATCLLAALWMATAAVALMAWLGQLQS